MVSACGVLNTPGATYTLTGDVNSSGTCFTIGADDITLDGAGYTVNYSMTNAGYGISDSGGYDNFQK